MRFIAEYSGGIDDDNLTPVNLLINVLFVEIRSVGGVGVLLSLLNGIFYSTILPLIPDDFSLF